MEHLDLLQPKPSAVSRLLVFAVAISQDPLVIYEVYATLDSRECTLFEFDFALLSPAYHNRSVMLVELMLPTQCGLRQEGGVIFR